MNPSVLLSLIHDLQARVMQLSDSNAQMQQKIAELQQQLDADSKPKKKAK